MSKIMMIKNIITDLYNKFFKKEEENIVSTKPNKSIMEYIYDKTNSPTHEMMNKINYDKIGEPEIINPQGEKTILLLDDVPYTQLLYLEDVKKINTEFNLDVYQKFKIVRCLGTNAGFLAYKYFIIDKNPCDIGILDITLGHRVNVTGSWFMELDGIDIAKYISVLNSDFKFLLCTAHTINIDNYIVNNYNKKCIKFFDKELINFYLNKNSDRYISIYNLIKD